MRAPTIAGTIERRLLLNYRVEPDVVQDLLPPPFRPHLTPGGGALAGICFVALRHHRPRGLPGFVGLRSEGAAHRFAVEWDDPEAPDGRRVGVYIRRRDTASLVNRVVGGRLFPGEHEPARFEVEDEPERLRVAFASGDGAVAADVTVEPSTTFTSATGLFADLAGASAFFAAGSVAYSETRAGGRFDGVELETPAWHVDPVAIVDASSTFFDGLGTLDGALIMRGIPVVWRPRAQLGQQLASSGV
jgi:hypothetical protein